MNLKDKNENIHIFPYNRNDESLTDLHLMHTTRHKKSTLHEALHAIYATLYSCNHRLTGALVDHALSHEAKHRKPFQTTKFAQTQILQN